MKTWVVRSYLTSQTGKRRGRVEELVVEAPTRREARRSAFAASRFGLAGKIITVSPHKV